MGDLTLIIAVIGIPALVLATALLGYGKSRPVLTDQDVKGVLAEQDPDASLSDLLISTNHRSAIGLTSDGRFFGLRSMGQDVSSRLVVLDRVVARAKMRRVSTLSVSLKDPGFPDLVLTCSPETAREWEAKINDSA